MYKTDLPCFPVAFSSCFTVFEVVLKHFRRVSAGGGVPVFFSSGTPPSALTRWKRFKTASNTVTQQRIWLESRVSQSHLCNTTSLEGKRFHFLVSRAWVACGCSVALSSCVADMSNTFWPIVCIVVSSNENALWPCLLRLFYQGMGRSLPCEELEIPSIVIFKNCGSC